MRRTVFISHGDSLVDNEFTKWISLKLIAMGYQVWCDLLSLDKGVDHWNAIESQIRNNTCKFLPVLSVFSNRREGVLKELAVAEKVKKQLSDPAFIIPLVIDEKLSFDDINIEANRLNAINCKQSWARGLRDLLEALHKQGVPRSKPNAAASNALYRQILLHDRKPLRRKEIYESNWFEILSFPRELHFHAVSPSRFRNDEFGAARFAKVPYNLYLASFATEAELFGEQQSLSSSSLLPAVTIPTERIVSGDLIETDFIRPSVAKRLLIDIVNQSLGQLMANRGLRTYKMSNRVGYWIQKGDLEQNKFNGVQLLGKDHSNMWHYGVSAAGKLYPSPVVMLSSHIFFTSNGKDLIESDSWQHSARRRLGKNWWNGRWRRLLRGFADYLAEGTDVFHLPVGPREQIIVSAIPLEFEASRSYSEPVKDTLSEEVEIASLSSGSDPEEDAANSINI